MSDSDERAALRSVAELWMEQVWRRRNLDALDRLHAPTFVDHTAAGRGSDSAAYRAGIAELYAAFPAWEAVTEDLVVDEATASAAIRWSARGTHAGPFLGHAATNRRSTFTGIEIIRVAQGRIVERWGEWDGLALLEQLGKADARE
jgi:predicted ester cyclase